VDGDAASVPSGASTPLRWIARRSIIEHEIVVPGEGPPRGPDPPLTPFALDALTISFTELLDFALRR